MLQELFEQRRRRFILSLAEQARSGVAMPAVRMSQQRDQFFRRGGAEMRQLGLLEGIGNDAIDAAAVVATIQIEMFLDGLRQRTRVLDDFPVHVGKVESAV